MSSFMVVPVWAVRAFGSTGARPISDFGFRIFPPPPRAPQYLSSVGCGRGIRNPEMSARLQPHNTNLITVTTLIFVENIDIALRGAINCQIVRGSGMGRRSGGKSLRLPTAVFATIPKSTGVAGGPSSSGMLPRSLPSLALGIRTFDARRCPLQIAVSTLK
jgi:hypothetical protein